MKYLVVLTFLFFSISLKAQTDTVKISNSPGIIIGNILDEDNSKPVSYATISLLNISDTNFKRNAISGKEGDFNFENLPFGYYRLQISNVGYTPLKLDSIHLRTERFDFDLNEIRLSKKSGKLEEIIVYAEKQLIENRDGKIIFNAGESSLSSGATTTELLKQTPLVNVDNDGKIMLRGKDVKVLIDDKPVELNGKQLQDLLESMPGSMIEKIEVMTTPPPQYSNERGGVINIVTKKGKVGMNGRLNLNYGTRGEAGLNSSFSYRKKTFSLNISVGYGYNKYQGNSNSTRQNLYRDSSNFFNTDGFSNSSNNRPNARVSIDYDLAKRNNVNFTSMYNSNDAGSNSNTQYLNLNQYNVIYKLSDRDVSNNTKSNNPNFNLTYTHKGKNPKEIFNIIYGLNYNTTGVEKNFFQQFLNPDQTSTGIDSTQQQIFDIKNHTNSIRINYDKPLNHKVSFNLGSNYTGFISHNILNTMFLKKPEMILVANTGLSNNFLFYQTIFALRAAIRYDFIQDFYVNAGLQQEYTYTHFDLKNDTNSYANNYWTALPFVTIMKKWKNEVSITLTYKRTIQRPGLNELNPSIDYSDPYNRRFGNPFLLPYYVDNFDFIAGKWKKSFFINASIGYNSLQNIYSAIRTLLPDGKTEITWQNISGRKEYEASTWGGFTISKKWKVNLNFGYTYNVYSEHDRLMRKFRNGGSFYSTLNSSYQFSILSNANISTTFNRFSNPQGSVRTAISMNIGVQQKFFNKKLIVALNVIDPFYQQQNKFKTYGTNFIVESYSFTQTRNFRLALSYILSKTPKRKIILPGAKNMRNRTISK